MGVTVGRRSAAGSSMLQRSMRKHTCSTGDGNAYCSMSNIACVGGCRKCRSFLC